MFERLNVGLLLNMTHTLHGVNNESEHILINMYRHHTLGKRNNKKKKKKSPFDATCMKYSVTVMTDSL